MRRGLLVNLALSAGVTLLMLALLEGGARLLEKPRSRVAAVADYIWDWDEKMPGGFYVMKSDAVGWPPWEEFNGDGLRDRTRPHEKPDVVKRVAILGDSVTLGADVRPEEAYPRVLETRLQAEGRSVEVMSVALWGWSTRQERIAWQRIARHYHPDAAILAVCLNDIPELQNNLSRPPRWLAALHARSALVRLAVDAQGREIDNVERLFQEPDSPRVREALERFFDEVRTLRAEVERDGARFSLIVFPFRFQVRAGAPAPVVQRRVKAFCEAERVGCLDLLPSLRPLGEAAFLDYDHLTPAGARAAADGIAVSGLLPVPPTASELLRRAVEAAADPGSRQELAWLEAPDQGPPPALALRLLESPDPAVRRAAAWTLEKAGAAAVVAALPELTRVLRQDVSTGARAAAAAALGASASRAAVEALFGALSDGSEAVRYAAARALAALGATAEDTPGLLAALESRDDFVSAYAAWTLGNLGEGGGAAVPALARSLGRERTEAVVAGALARIGPAAAEAVPALVEMLRSRDPGRRWRAARTLGRIGVAAQAAAPELAEALSDEEPMVRMHAARALGRVGPGARQIASTALQRATGDRDESVRQEARQALQRLY